MFIKRITINENPNAGCNNGEFNDVVIITTSGRFSGSTCRCGSGCANSWNLNSIREGMEFVSENELFEQLEG